MQKLAGEAVTLVGEAIVVEENAAVLADTVLIHPVDAVNAIPVMFTTLLTPEVDNVAVVNVPVPGEPVVKVMGAVVELMVFVPLTLYVTV